MENAKQGQRAITGGMIFGLIILASVVFQAVFVLSEMSWREGTIKSVTGENVAILTPDNNTVELRYNTHNKIMIPGQHIRYRAYKGDLIDFWYDGENIELRS